MKKLLILLLSIFLNIQINAENNDNVAENKDDKNDSSENNIVVDEESFEKDYIERQILRYERLIKDYLTEIQALIKRSVEEKKRLVEQKYSSVITKEIVTERNNRAEAIVLFENFIKKYPDHKEFTPSAMYRLAELYYERAMLKHEKLMEAYDKQIEQFELGEMKKEPSLPVVDLSESIRLYRSINQRFPNYKYIGGSYYMLGYCLEASGRSEEAVLVWKEILDNNIKTGYLAEIYLRIGDYYFNNNDLPSALKYFQKGIQYKDSPFYDKILYKLAWTHYRNNAFDKAVELFTELVFFADEMKKQGKDRGQDLRKEAVQYIAISFADEEWGSIEKAIAYFNKIKGEEFEKDVFERLGKYYYENSSYDQAEKAYRFVIKRHPYYENTPRIHHKLIQLYHKERSFDKAFKETEIFAKKYDRDSEWARKNRANPTILKYAADLAKDSLLQSAAYHHRQAQAYKDKGEFEKAREEYIIASESYEEYLDKFPYTSESYDISYSLADTLFQSGQIKKAVVVFERIRDDKNQDKYKNDAAFATFICYNTIWENSPERLVKSEEKRGKPFSKLEKKLIESSDIYLEVAKDAPDKAAVAYTVARIFFDHGKFDEAEQRYLKIINEFPSSDAAIMAARDIINAYNEKEDWVNVAKWSKILTDRLQTKEEGTGKKVREEFKTYRVSALFFYAQKLQEENKHKEAAEEYLRIVEENPYNENADKALFNAAFSFEKALMFDSAMTIHERIYKEYPYSEMAPKSLYLVAYNAERSYNFEKAIDAYKLLYKKYPSFEKKSAALYNAGFLLERLKKYNEAANYYKLYYSEESDKRDGKEALYFVGLMKQKAEKWKPMIIEYNRFIDRFKSDQEMQPYVMRAYYQITKVYEDKFNNRIKAKEYYQKILDFYNNRKIENDEALLYAAEAKFKLLEDVFEEYVKTRITGKNNKQLQESLKKKVELKNEVEKSYKEVFLFNVFEWTIASLYRIGFLYQSFSDALFNADPPPGLSYEEEDLYMQILQERAAPIEEKAVQIYTDALEKAREMRVFNNWTQLITEKLSVLRPEQYKVGKTPMFAVNSKIETGYPIALSLDKEGKKEYKRAGIREGEKKEDGGEAKKTKQSETPKKSSDKNTNKKDETVNNEKK